MRSAAVLIRTNAGHPADSIDRIQLGCQERHLGEGKSDTLNHIKFSLLPEPHIRCYAMFCLTNLFLIIKPF